MNLNKQCKILTKKLCDGGKCSFFKTTKQYRDDLEKYPPIDYKALYESRHKNESEVIQNGEGKAENGK